MVNSIGCRRVGLAGAILVSVVVAACGSGGGDTGGSTSTAGVELVALGEGRRAEPGAAVDAGIAGGSIRAFGPDLFTAVAAEAGAEENVIVSPASVAIALAMLEPGATGDASRQLRELLRIDDPEAFHASLNALEQDLEARVAATGANEGEDPGEVVVRVANAAYLQQGYPFEQPYLDTVSKHYGPVLHAVDFEPDPDAVAHEINRFVAEATEERITELVDDGQIRSETVLALVNALYLKASWAEVFDEAETREGSFTRRAGGPVDVPMMHGTSGSSAQGDGWVAATKPYVGGLSAQFVLPDEGRFDEVASDIGGVVARYDDVRTSGAELVVPRFETRFAAELAAALRALGLTAPYEQGNLLGIADDPKLVLDVAMHQTHVAMDEQGTEAAAATILTAYPTSGPASPPVPVVLDRPFLLRIFDERTGATLFLGRIVDPTG